MKSFLKSFVAVIAAVSVAGCSMFLAPQSETFTVNSNQSGAKVTVNGQTASAPATFNLPGNKRVDVTVSKKGYETYNTSVGYSISSYGLLDIVGGVFFLVPLIGLISPGAWQLETSTVNANLVPAE